MASVLSLPLNARLCALGALVHTLDKGKPLDSAWAADRHFSTLSPSDRAFAQMLAKTTLRRLGQIEAILAPVPLSVRYRPAAIAHHAHAAPRRRATDMAGNAAACRRA